MIKLAGEILLRVFGRLDKDGGDLVEITSTTDTY